MYLARYFGFLTSDREDVAKPRQNVSSGATLHLDKK